MIRDATQQRGAGMVIAVIQDESQGELPQDRITAVCHNLSIEPRYVISPSLWIYELLYEEHYLPVIIFLNGRSVLWLNGILKAKSELGCRTWSM